MTNEGFKRLTIMLHEKPCAIALCWWRLLWLILWRMIAERLVRVKSLTEVYLRMLNVPYVPEVWLGLGLPYFAVDALPTFLYLGLD